MHNEKERKNRLKIRSYAELVRNNWKSNTTRDAIRAVQLNIVVGVHIELPHLQSNHQFAQLCSASPFPCAAYSV